MVFGFSEWNADFPKMLPTQGFLAHEGSPFLQNFLPGDIPDTPVDF